MRIRFFLSILFIPVFLVFTSGAYAQTDPEPDADTVLEDSELLQDEDLYFSDEDTEELFDELDSIMNESLDEGFTDEDEDFFEDEFYGEEETVVEDTGEGATEDGAPAEEEKVLITENMSPEELGIKMIFVKGGCFMMGDNFGDGHFDEKPVHEVCVDDYFLQETELTQGTFEKLMGFNPSVDKGDELPLNFMSWSDAVFFLTKLNEVVRDGGFRLPSEAEWEFAARGGGKLEKWPGTDDEFILDDFAWYVDNSGDKVQPVRTKLPNQLGFYDMAGNVWEWCYDYYDMNYYKNSDMDNPEGPEFTIWHVLRGGSVFEEEDKLRTSARYGNVPSRRTSNTGIRLAR